MFNYAIKVFNCDYSFQDEESYFRQLTSFSPPPFYPADIAEGGLNTMLSIYKALLPSLGGYLVENATIQWARLEKLIARIFYLFFIIFMSFLKELKKRIWVRF